MPALKHIHSYQRVHKKPQLYYCSHPECSHYARKEFLIGKRSTCACGNEFILSRLDLRLKNPRCPACKGGNVPTKEIIGNIITEEFFPELLQPPSQGKQLTFDQDPEEFTFPLNEENEEERE